METNLVTPHPGLALALALALAPALAWGAPPTGQELEGPTRRELIEAAAVLRDGVDANVLIWRAGRGPLAGAPAARNAERERDRLAALTELESRMDPASGQATAWLGYLGVLLRQDTRHELWCAAARTAGDVGAYSWAPELVEELAPERPPRRRVAARAALQHLYGRWFATPEEARPFVETVRPGPSTRLLVAELRRESEVASRRLLEVLALRPAEALARLGDPNPVIRRGAARILGENAGSLDPAATTAALLSHLDREAEPEAFHAVLQALLVHLQNKPHDAPELVRLRNSLLAVIQSGDDSRALSVALALSRMSWAEAAGPNDVLAGVESIGRVLSRLCETEGRLEDDPDALVGTLEALLALSSRTRDLGRGEDLRRSLARGPVLTLVQDTNRVPEIRIGAVASLGPFARPQDWRLLADVLEDPRSSSALRHAVLGAFRSILPEFAPGSPEARDVVAQIELVSASDDPDLRRRAFSLLREERLADLVRAELRPAYLLDELAKEDRKAQRTDVLDMIRRFGTPDMLPKLLDLPTFDTMASASPERLAELHAALRALCRGDGPATMRAAQRLATVQDDRTRLERFQRALNLVAALDQAAVRELTPDDHRRVCAWAWWLHVAGLPPKSAVTDGRAFLERLSSVHLYFGAEAHNVPGFGDGPFAHLKAVTQAELVAIQDVEGGEGRAEDAFDEAIKRAADDPSNTAFVDLVLRDRARFRARAGDVETRRRALDEFRALGGHPVLENSDLRQIAGLVRELTDAATGRIERFQLLMDLVGRDAWRSEPDAVRLQDLKDLGAAALDSGVVEHAGLVADLLKSLPDEPPTNGTSNPRPVRVWDGLERNPDWLAELRTLRERLRGGAGSASDVTEPVVSPPAPEESTGGAADTRRPGPR